MNIYPHRFTALFTATLALSLAHLHAQQVFTTDFSSASDFDNNFVELTNSSTGNVTWSSNAPGFLSKSGTGSRNVIFDTSATGGTNGSGGTSGSLANTNYGDVLVSANFNLRTNAPSFGLLARVSDDYTSGYLGFVSFTTNTMILRIYEGANPSSTSAGTLVAGLTNNLTTSFTSYYKGTFDLKNDASDLDFTLSVYDATGTNLFSSLTWTDPTPLRSTGQVGMRFASEFSRVDSFSVVPEPASGMLVALGLAGIGLRWCLQKRRSRARQRA